MGNGLECWDLSKIMYFSIFLAQETDLSGPYFVSEERATLVNFTPPFGVTESAILTGLENANRDPLLILKIFSFQVWLLIVASIFISTSAASFIYIVIPSRNKRKNAKTFLRYSWMFYGSLLGKDFGDNNRWFLRSVSYRVSFRLLQCVWLFGPVMVLMYSYQGAITSSFASDKLKPIISSLDDLRSRKSIKIGTFAKSQIAGCFEEMRGTSDDDMSRRASENLKPPPRNRKWMEQIARGEEIMITDPMYLRIMVGERFNMTGDCGLRVIPIDFCGSYVAFGFRKHFRPHMQQKFKERLLWYNEGFLNKKFILATQATYDKCTTSNSAAPKALKLRNLVGAFMLYGVGMCAAICVFLMEKLSKCRK